MGWDGMGEAVLTVGGDGPAADGVVVRVGAGVAAGGGNWASVFVPRGKAEAAHG